MKFRILKNPRNKRYGLFIIQLELWLTKIPFS